MPTVSRVPSQPRIYMPTEKQLTKIYGDLAHKALKNGARPMAKPPANAERYAHYNITKPGLLGASEQVYAIKGQLYLKTQVVAPNAKPTWYKIGPAPLF